MVQLREPGGIFAAGAKREENDRGNDDGPEHRRQVRRIGRQAALRRMGTDPCCPWGAGFARWPEDPILHLENRRHRFTSALRAKEAAVDPIEGMGRKIRLVLWSWLLVMKAGAQVPNDDCAAGFAQGVPVIAQMSTSCQQGSGYGLLIVDSTHLASPDFPYPTNPLACSGYSASISAPAKDRWYSFSVPCFVDFSVFCSDTCDLSFWSGGDCASLVPLACFTFLPGITQYGTVAGVGYLPILDTMSLQISGNGLGQDVKYTLCLWDPTPICFSIPVLPSPTPVTWFTYDTLITPNTSTTAPDGSITINMQIGNGPYEILWNTGDTTFTIDSLIEGSYTFSIADSSGCTILDTIYVPFDLGTGAHIEDENLTCPLTAAGWPNVLTTENSSDLGSAVITLTDMTGRTLWSTQAREHLMSTLLPSLPKGIYCVTFVPTTGPSCAIKLVTTSLLPP